MNNLIPVFQNQENFGTKFIQINSVPIIMPKSYFASFYSLNCKIRITKGLDKEFPEDLPDEHSRKRHDGEGGLQKL